ncbi:MAG: GNAT family N-acetyltransferase [Flavobacteriaceae bacterium]|nr:GNAT family N-acetyltransferase [Flavobacteriaceae bacterium]
MLSFRKAQIDDLQLYFNWVNDPIVREQSFNSDIIDFLNHSQWFEKIINDNSCLMLVFMNEENKAIGQLRIQKQNENESIIGISVDSNYRGNGYAQDMLVKGTNYFLLENPNFIINAFIKEKNVSSKQVFEKAKFKFKKMVNHENSNSFHYIKKLNGN